MTTIFERAETALATLAVPRAMGRLITASGDLPDQFVVYSLIIGTPGQHADDLEIGREYLVQVTIYSRSGLASLPDVDGAMVSAGFTRSKERELPRDAQSGHYGLAKDFYFYDDTLTVSAPQPPTEGV